MKTQLIKIGNSRGIRIPKTIVEQCKLNGELNIEVKGKEVIVKAKENLREDWNDLFKKAKSLNENALLDGNGMSLSDWDDKEWKL